MVGVVGAADALPEPPENWLLPSGEELGDSNELPEFAAEFVSVTPATPPAKSAMTVPQEKSQKLNMVTNRLTQSRRVKTSQ